MQAKPLETMTSKELLALDVEPPKFTVSRFLPVGLHLLAGSPKITEEGTEQSYFATEAETLSGDTVWS